MQKKILKTFSMKLGRSLRGNERDSICFNHILQRMAYRLSCLEALRPHAKEIQVTIYSDVLRRSGYLMPIPRCPAVDLTKFEAVAEEIPSPYCYHEMLSYETREALKARFMRACNQRRWQYIQQAEVKAKK